MLVVQLMHILPWLVNLCQLLFGLYNIQGGQHCFLCLQKGCWCLVFITPPWQQAAARDALQKQYPLLNKRGADQCT